MLVVIKETSEPNFAASEEIRQISADNFAQVFIACCDKTTVPEDSVFRVRWRYVIKMAKERNRKSHITKS